MKKIALFGTSADPPSIAHQAILCWLSQQFDWVAVWASDNPFKSDQTPLKHRSAMLQLMVEDLNDSHGVHQCSHNIGFNPELSCTRSLHSIGKAKEQWPDAEFTLIIGSDLVSQFQKWYRIEEILQQVRVLVIPRPGWNLDEKEVEKLKKMGQVAIANVLVPDVSSTIYRSTKNSALIVPQVEAYIHQKKLYKR